MTREEAFAELNRDKGVNPWPFQCFAERVLGIARFEIAPMIPYPSPGWPDGGVRARATAQMEDGSEAFYEERNPPDFESFCRRIEASVRAGRPEPAVEPDFVIGGSA